MFRKGNTANRLRWQKPLTVTVLLVLLIVGFSFFVTSRINRREEENAFQRLYEETGSLAREIESKARDDRRQLETIASILSEYEDLSSPQVKALLHSCSSIGMMTDLELLLPDNTVVSPNPQGTPDGTLSFEKEAALGAHITDREPDISGNDSYILRHYVPVIQNGETTAMLYGVINLDGLPDELMSNPYGGEAAVYIIEGNTGDFLVDTWHEQPGNIWDLGERPMAAGYDHNLLKQGLIDGKTGYVVFVSQTTGEYLYFYYKPLTINSWRIALSVPEDLVFADANIIRNILNIFLALEAVCFLLYFFWMLRYVRRETNEKQRQLDTINYIYDVEQLLFNAHEQRQNIDQALEKIARITSAQAIIFLITDPTENLFSFIQKPKNEEKDKGVSARIGEISSCLPACFQKGDNLNSLCDLSSFRAAFPDIQTDPVKNMTAIPIQDSDGSVFGILAAFNLPDSGQAHTTLLKSVAFSFNMLCHNMRSYNAIREKGEKDVLSGLYNRNRYEQDLKKYPALCRNSLACIYVDANGLHELNNEEGHDAGDRMLKAVAGQLMEQFGNQHSYRIGGDEFLAFAIDMTEDDVLGRTTRMEEALKEQNFHISAGIQWTAETASLNTDSLERLIKAAEQRMYLAKKAYYENKAHDRRKER